MLTYKYYKFPTKDLVPKFWSDNVSISEIGYIKPKSDDIIDTSWYVNICYQGSVDLSSIEQYEIQVKTPNRIWFGQQR